MINCIIKAEETPCNLIAVLKIPTFIGLKKLASILLLAYYSFGVICLSGGDFSKIADLKDMYKSCEKEDPDITAADFVFEHLLNLGSIIESFEHHSNEKEMPHQPYHFHITSSQIVCNISHSPFFDFKKEEVISKPFIFHSENLILFDFSENVFKPPIV